MVTNEIFYKVVKMICASCFVLIFALFTWVQWQGVKAKRHEVVAQIIARDTYIYSLSNKLLLAGFSLSETLDYLYSAGSLYKQ